MEQTSAVQPAVMTLPGKAAMLPVHVILALMNIENQLHNAVSPQGRTLPLSA
jgi:hypothetical protein